eukprot:6205308-Karenia_brevis.AAC.1
MAAIASGILRRQQKVSKLETTVKNALEAMESERSKIAKLQMEQSKLQKMQQEKAAPRVSTQPTALGKSKKEFMLYCFQAGIPPEESQAWFAEESKATVMANDMYRNMAASDPY